MPDAPTTPVQTTTTPSATAPQRPTPSEPGAKNAVMYFGRVSKAEIALGLRQYMTFRDGVPADLKAKLSPVQLANFKPVAHAKKHDFKKSQRPIKYSSQLVKKTA